MVSVALSACSDSTSPADGWTPSDVPGTDASDVPAVRDTGTNGDTDAGPADVSPVVLAARPDHGPFSGGNTVVIRGSNFTDDLEVSFGGLLVQPRDTKLVDEHRLQVIAPAANPGTVDITVSRGAQTSTVAQAYTYDAFYADPDSGSVAGGTVITLRGSGTNWTNATTVLIDASPCAQLVYVSPTELTCTVPAHIESSVPITITTGSEAITVPDAFSYYQSADPNSGGFGGGQLQGTLNVTVLDSYFGMPVPNAFVFIGENPAVAPPLSGITNPSGQTTLSGSPVQGPLSLTISAHCFASTRFDVLDSRDVTVFLTPWLNEVPGVDCGPPNPPSGGGGGRGIYAATVSGELIWRGPNEFGPNPWFNVPAPQAGERRVAYVMTTEPSIYYNGNPDPGAGGTVLEQIAPHYGGKGYPYNIIVRPSSLAVYAFAGLERDNADGSTAFTPYVMGVARNVLASPRAQLMNVDVQMNIPLDHDLVVTLHDLPGTAGANSGPDRMLVENWIDLGGEGVIPRDDVAVDGPPRVEPYHLVAQPAFLGELADARMIVRSFYGTGQDFGEPLSTVLVNGIQTPDQEVDVGGWVGIPVPDDAQTVVPLLPARKITFTEQGGVPDMHWAMLAEGQSSCRYGPFPGSNLGDVVFWQQLFPGTQREVDVPDISVIPTLTDMPPGLYNLSICSFRVAGFDYEHFRYQYLYSTYWTAYSSNSLVVSR